MHAGLLLLLLASPCAALAPAPAVDLGNYSLPITTSSGAAQRLFDAGLMQEFSFNQAESRRAFAAAAAADPARCAMCQWGVAYAWGPFLNHPVMSAEQAQRAYAASRAAAAMVAAAASPADYSALERGLIGAIVARHPSADAGANQTVGYLAYVDALEALVARLAPATGAAADAAGALLAEALMLLESNDYYAGESMGDTNTTARQLRPFSARASAVLRPLLPRAQPMALHLYIHLTEPAVPGSGGPGAGMGEGAADALRAQRLSGSGHLEHMPGHLYLRVGRYADAVAANDGAAAADSRYTTLGMSPYGPCHNLYFGVYAACMAGMRDAAYVGAARMRAVYATNLTRRDAPGLDQGWEAALTSYVRFGDWEKLLADERAVPAGAPPTPYASLLRHYARGLASNARGAAAAAAAELASLRALRPAVSRLDGSSFDRLADVANLTLSAALALRGGGDATGALAMLRSAAAAQNSWHYDVSAACCVLRAAAAPPGRSPTRSPATDTDADTATDTTFFARLCLRWLANAGTAQLAHAHSAVPRQGAARRRRRGRG